MRGEKSKCSLEFHVILSVTIENICKQITPAAKFAIRPAMANLRKLLDMCSNLASPPSAGSGACQMRAVLCSFPTCKEG